MSGWSTQLALPDEPDATLMLREYMAEMVRRWYGRPEQPDEVDAALAVLHRTPGVSVIPQEDQKLLTPEDRDAAVIIGDRPKHLIAIED